MFGPMSSRSVARIVTGHTTLEGAGFQVTRPFPTNLQDDFDPFLLLDQMGPQDYAPGQAKGAPDHPHRGFETVTYVLEGEMEHADSAGHRGKLGPGDVQWMTAGDGIVHAEMPSEAFQKRGGRMLGFQLWVNLPKRDKRMRPRYQEIAAANIPVAEKDGVRVRVVAGEALGQKAAIDTRTPIQYLHFTLKEGARFTQPVPKDHAAMVWVISGAGRFGSDRKAAQEGQAVFLAADGDAIDFEAAGPLDMLLLSGVPIREPVARYGPFVMNTREEIMQAVEDFRAGRMGSIEAKIG